MSGYTTNALAAAIRVTGACIFSLILFCLSCCCNCVHQSGRGQEQKVYPWYIRSLYTVVFYTLAGVLDCAILRHNHVDIGGIDIPHSAGAAALRGFIFFILTGPVLMAAIFTILLPLFLTWQGPQMGLHSFKQ